MTTLMPSICLSRGGNDSTVMQRVWSYRRNFSQDIKGAEQNVYTRSVFDIDRRNCLLFLVPTMYSVAKGQRHFVSETYGKMRFRDVGDYEFHRQLIHSTIPHHRTAMTPVVELLTPNLYDVSLFPEHILSPFHRANRHSYRYRTEKTDTNVVIVHFRPKLPNTQFVSGHAMVNANTGRIQYAIMEGEYDMIKFKLTVYMGQEDKGDLLPDRCYTDASFKFLGNNIKSSYAAFYHCPTNIPDSITDQEDLSLLEQIRPIPLYKNEKDIFSQNEITEQKDETGEEQHPHRKHILDVAWDIGNNLVNSLNAERHNASINISPLLNPLYMGYSQSKGLSYKLDIGSRYAWNSHRYLTLNPRLGYNFKLRQFYYTAPLRMTYNPKRNGFAEITWANGNRISNGALEETFHSVVGDSIDMPEFKDEYVQAINNIVAFDWLELVTGVVYHQRKASSPGLMRQAGLQEEYRSFAPFITFRLNPWEKGPTLTVNYERSIKDMLGSNLNYERWEIDASFKRKLRSLRVINARTGTGFYTKRSSEYFVDFANFRDNNLPTGWDDEWSGQFQLLDSRWYNESDYYLRGHLSYESPQMMLAWLPVAGRFIESERIYVSALSIEHSRPYYELGYGFTNRLFSTGLFCSLLGNKFSGFGCRFTIELFRRW